MASMQERADRGNAPRSRRRLTLRQAAIHGYWAESVKLKNGQGEYYRRWYVVPLVEETQKYQGPGFPTMREALASLEQTLRAAV